MASPQQKHSPAPSTESEQSRALDINEDRDIFDFNFPSDNFNIDVSDVNIQPPPYQVPQADPVGINDTTMLTTFGAGFGAFGDLAQFGGDVNILGIGSDYFAKLADHQPLPQTVDLTLTPSLEALLANTDWNASFSVPPTAVNPAALTLPSPPQLLNNLKRKDSSSSDEQEQPVKRARGRPPKTGSGSSSPMIAKLPLSRQSKVTSPQPTPLVRTVSLDGDADDSVKRTASGKSSTARPKSVVPEKYFKDGTAQAITGMTMEQILAFPTFDELLKQVSPEKKAGTQEFGDRIADNRDKAKDAAKKSRDEKRQKIEQLESQVEGLEDTVKGMKMFLQSLLGSGRVSPAEVAMFASC